MTIPSTPSELTYAGDDVTVSFPITFVFSTAADIKVVRTDPTGDSVELVSGFSITGGGGSTGTCELGTPLATGYTLTLLDDPEITQTTDYADNDPFPASAHEGALDRGVRISKRLYQMIVRALRFPDGDPVTDGALASVDTRKGKYLFFNAVTGAVEYAVALVTTTLTQSVIGQLLNPETAAEVAAAVTVVNYWYPVGHVYRYGTNTTPGTTDMSDAIQAAWDVIWQQEGGIVRLPAAVMKITRDIEPNIGPTVGLNRTFNVIGEGKEASTITSTGGFGLKVYSNVPPARTDAFVSCLFQGFQVLNGSGIREGIGLDIYSMQRSVIDDVRLIGFDYGCQIRSSWSNQISGRCQFMENNVGLKVPRAGAGATLNEGFNAIDILSLSCANCNKAGVSLANGSNINIQGLLVETTPVGVYLIEQVQRITVHNLYYENAGGGSYPYTESNRAGVLQGYVVYCGKDEDGNTGDTGQPIVQLVISQPMRHFGEGVIHLENVSSVLLPDDEPGRAYIEMGPNVTNVRALMSWSGANATSNPLRAGKSKSTNHAVLRNLAQNWIPNGNFSLPNAPYYTLTGAGAAAAIGTQTIDGALARVLDLTLPNGVTTVTISFWVNGPTGAEYATTAPLIAASLHALASSADVSSVTIRGYDAGTPHNGAGQKTSGLTSWFVITADTPPNEYNATNTQHEIRITVERTTGVGVEHLYIDEVAVFPEQHPMISPLSALDVDVGFSGQAVCTVASGAWFYVDIVTGYVNANYFEFVATAVYDAAQTATEIQYEKLTGGGNDGTVRVWSNKNNATFAYRVLPRTMRLI